jgi:hypothetical protein
MPHSLQPHDRRAFGLLAALSMSSALAGCDEDPVPTQGIAHPTLVEVAPSDFLGRVRCIDAPGAMRRYVATVYDVDAFPNPDDESSGGAGAWSEETVFALPSSTVRRGDGKVTAIPCTQNVGFSRIVDNHRYYAEIDGYDRDDLIALAPGTRVLYDPETLERVEPRWTTSCSKDTPVQGLPLLVRRIGSCKELSDSAEETEPLVELSIDGALFGDLACVSDGGSVDRYEVTPPNGVPLEAPCGETITLMGLEVSGATVTLPLRAFEAGATEPTWGSTCLAEVIAGVTTTATCLPLDPNGVLEVDPEDALAALGLECSASAFVELDVVVDDGDEPKIVTPSDCTRPLQFGNLAPGPATARATAHLPDGSLTGEALCTGTIAPGETAHAECAAPP